MTITFTNYTPDKLLKMYGRYFLFFLRLSPCVFHGPSHCADCLSFCLHVHSDQLKPGNDISFCMILALAFWFVM